MYLGLVFRRISHIARISNDLPENVERGLLWSNASTGRFSIDSSKVG